MKRIFLMALLSCILSAGLYSLTPPPPMRGISTIRIGHINFRNGNFDFEITPPPGWGMGNYSRHDDGSAYLELYPFTKGYACVFDAQFCDTHAQAVNHLRKVRQTLTKAKKLPDGFESTFENAYFSCRVEGPFVIYTWYSIPKKEISKNKHWDNLKSVFHVVPTENSIVTPQPQAFSFKDFLIKRNMGIEFDPITRTMDGWVFSHSTKLSYVFFKISPEKSALRQDNAFTYQMHFNDFEINANGYFYIDWDRKDLSHTVESYQQFADKISQEMQTIDSNQIFGKIQLFPDHPGLILRGQPYNLIIIREKDLLLGFAFRAIENDRTIRGDILVKSVSGSSIE